MKKTFDCVEMKRRGAKRIYEKTAHMTLEQQLAFWQERTGALRKRQQAAREESETAVAGHQLPTHG